MKKLLLFIVLLLHGIGHLQGGVIGLWQCDSRSWNFSSPLLSQVMETAFLNITGFMLYFTAALAGIGAALSYRDLVIKSSHWKMLALIAALISSMALFLFPQGLTLLFHKICALAVNLLIFYAWFLPEDQWTRLMEE